MKGRWICAGFLFLCFLPGIGRGGTDGEAGTESPFVLGMGARALAMGKAFTAVADDATAVYWNPGGLAQLQQMELGACHVFLNEGTLYDTLAYAYPWYKLGAFAVAGLNVRTGDIERRDDHDYLQGTFDYSQSQGLLAFGGTLFPGLGAGLVVKLERQNLDTYQSLGVGMDLGVLYNPGNVFSFGIMLRNILSPEIKLIDPVTLPMNATLGVAYRYAVDQAKNHRLLISLDAEKPALASLQLHGGLEYRMYQIVSLRAGWDRDRLLGGAGVEVGGAELDYALTYREPNGSLQMLSLSWKFGLPVAEADKERRTRRTAEIFNRLVQEEFSKHRNSGAAFLNHDQFENAALEFKRALGWNPDKNTEADLARALTLGKMQTVRRFYQQALDKTKAGQWLAAAAVLQEAGQYKIADPEVSALARKIDDRLLNQGRAAKLASRHKKNRAGFIASLSEFLAGRYENALKGWQTLLEKDPDYPEARDCFAQAREASLRQAALASVAAPAPGEKIKNKLAEAESAYARQQFKASRLAWQSVLESDPAHEGARLGLERTEILLKALAAQGIE